ncbi:LPXTG-motif cell wall-anchored protein [Nocardioides thalensis]|uniref:LPXTG-motif cell wall-anchored protein n=1 Tax=Nocardioides thalensis TaxID=1914755 RepID=A0A853C3S6_9ACTN|nr:LPXTG cell wall anchor domain-containing protein [Nocardioides thalensis]NYJ02365.1 LPXTG-motif cell wall-anchored protein [Nocardioides thalensis]
MRKLFLMVSVAMAALFVTSSATADPYGPIPKPLCIIKIIKAEPGERVIVQIGARLNAKNQPAGTLTVHLRTNINASAGTTNAADVVWTKTVHTNGRMIRLVGPVVPEGTHKFTSTFVPDDATECRQCQAEQVFTVSDDDGGGDGDDDGDNGLLPDTGGPAVLWLLAGLVLVAAGAGIVVYSRRRAEVPAH